ncbi:hypothetical protein DYBT9275_05281 [Dyadobacter sp. CECT 9275]|uniref:Uncharacterized protein n=1 Tax=Dyadobacter helix TaxID=2822344 RepID=A0A916N764_9BACT|nr:hypothetical protein DYBT9275_05281 [Dyadobacter sp. CECT 9275]
MASEYRLEIVEAGWYIKQNQPLRVGLPDKACDYQSKVLFDGKINQVFPLTELKRGIKIEAPYHFRSNGYTRGFSKPERSQLLDHPPDRYKSFLVVTGTEQIVTNAAFECRVNKTHV